MDTPLRGGGRDGVGFGSVQSLVTSVTAPLGGVFVDDAIAGGVGGSPSVLEAYEE